MHLYNFDITLKKKKATVPKFIIFKLHKQK